MRKTPSSLIPFVMAVLLSSAGISSAQSWSGSGDFVIDFSRPATPAIVHITGNAGSDYFGVVSYTSSGGYIDLLANTTDPYDGIRPLDFEGNHAGRFVITATGAWTIIVLPITSTHTIVMPGALGGTGDDVLALAGGQPNLATVLGNASSRYFGIVGYDSNGAYLDLLVNTTDPYSGVVPLDRRTVYLVVQAEDAWSISVTRISGPTIASVTSKKGSPGSPAAIVGADFASQPASNTVEFGKYEATVTKASSTKLTVTIPSKCRKGKSYQVTVKAYGGTSNAVSFKVR